MLIIDWDSEQYFTSWEEWFKSFDYEKMIKEIIKEEECDDEGEASDFLICRAIEAKTITVLEPFFDEYDDYKIGYTEKEY